MNLSICSFSFHRLLDAGRQDIFQYIETCRELGCTHLQPWNAHFARGWVRGEITQVGRRPAESAAPVWLEPPREAAFLAELREAAGRAGLGWELIAVDGAHIYDPNPETVAANRLRARRWVDFAAALGAGGLRIDAGGPHHPEPAVLDHIIIGYRELIAEAATRGVSIFIENHWGSSQIPDNILLYLREVPGLKLLFDTNNWAPGRQHEGWEKCAPFASATHFKTFSFDENGQEPSVDLPLAARLLLDSGYQGVWGIESVPRDGQEVAAARATIALLRQLTQ